MKNFIQTVSSDLYGFFFKNNPLFCSVRKHIDFKCIIFSPSVVWLPVCLLTTSLCARGVLCSMFGRRVRSFHCSLTCTAQPVHNPEEEISSESNVSWSQMIYIGWINNYINCASMSVPQGELWRQTVLRFRRRFLSSKMKEDNTIKPFLFLTFIVRYNFINDSGVLEILMANSVFKCRYCQIFLCPRQKETMQCQELD